VAEEIHLTRVVESALALMEHMIRKATTRFTFRKGENIPPVRGNFQRLEQVTINLLQNACQALPDKDRKIEVEVFYDEAERQVVLSVRDEGIGMDEETLRRIREPFFTTRRDTGGTGLGVPISERIVIEHGGMLLFKSEPGKGTVARVELPVGER
jgi:polar amino acid transport system substrate-binding protein